MGNDRLRELTVQNLAKFATELAQAQADIQALQERPLKVLPTPEVVESEEDEPFIDLLRMDPKALYKWSIRGYEDESRREKKRIIVRRTRRRLRGRRLLRLSSYHDLRRRRDMSSCEPVLLGPHLVYWRLGSLRAVELSLLWSHRLLLLHHLPSRSLPLHHLVCRTPPEPLLQLLDV